MNKINFLISRHIEQFDEATARWIRIQCPGMSGKNAMELLESLEKITNKKYRIVNDDEVFPR